MTNDEQAAAGSEAARRWHLVQGQDTALPLQLDTADAAIGGVLHALYGTGSETCDGGLGD